MDWEDIKADWNDFKNNLASKTKSKKPDIFEK